MNDPKCPDSPLDAIIHLVKHKIPYYDWPDELKIAGVSEDLMGKVDFPFGPIPHWIKCSDRMPPEDTWILVANKNRVDMMVYMKDRGFIVPHLNYYFADMTITHWMPLPEAPNE